MSKKLIKILKIAIVVFIIITILFSFVVSQNEHHFEVCHNDHCVVCDIIHLAKNIISISSIMIISIVIGFLIYFFLSRLQKNQTIIVLISLVFQKVRLNE